MRQTSPTKYLYIMGRGYSGTTILSILIGQSNAVASEGEIVMSFREGYEARRCADREVFSDSAFWTRVGSTFERRTGTAFGPAVRQLNQQAHYRRIVPNLLSSSDSAHVAETRRLIEALYDSIAEAASRPVVLDSSKEAATAVFLLRHVSGSKVIHFVRNPIGMSDSYVRRIKSAKWFHMFRRHFRVERHYLIPMITAAIVWDLQNAVCEVLRLFYPTRIIQLHYEDLCSDPRALLERLEQFAGVSLTASKAAAAGRLPLNPGHALSGNAMMRKEKIVFAPEAGLPRHLTAFDKAVVTLCTFPLMIAYGYFGRRGTKPAAIMRPSPQ